MKNNNEVWKNLLETDYLSHAYLIETNHNANGERVALNFAKSILFQKEEKTEEEFNHLLEQDAIPDLKIIRPITSFIKKEQLLELQKEFSNKSVSNGKRVYIIFSAEALNASSANSILKFLEEPHDDIVAILVTHNRYKVLPTILSRCQILSLEGSADEIEYSEECEKFVSLLLEQKNLFLSQNLILKELMVDKQSAIRVLKEAEIYLFHIYHQLINGKENFVIDETEINLSVNQIDKILKYITIIEENFEKMAYNINYKLWLDSFLIDLMEV